MKAKVILELTIDEAKEMFIAIENGATRQRQYKAQEKLRAAIHAVAPSILTESEEERTEL